MRNIVLSVSVLSLALAVSSAFAVPVNPAVANAGPAAASKSPPSLYEQGLLALDKKQWVEAEKLFSQAAEKEPKSPTPLLGLAEVARLSKKDDVAEKWIRKAVELAPHHPDSLTAMGRLVYAKGKYDQAEQYLQKAAVAAPNNVAIYLDLGELYLNALRQPQKAVNVFQKVVELNAKHAGAHYGLGNAYLAQRDYPNAIKNLTEANRLAPDNPLALISLGDAHAAKGDSKAALSALQDAAKISPKVAIIPLRQGMLYQQAGQWNEAMAAYEQAIRLDAKLVPAYNNLAWIAAERKLRLDAANQWASKAVELAPQEPTYKDTLAWVKRASGDQKGALQLLETIAKNGNPSAETLYHLGIVRAESGKKAEAVDALKRALILDPKFAQAQDASQRLKQLASQ